MDPLLSVADLAEMFGLSEATVRTLCARHEWPHLKFGRVVRFTELNVAEIIEIHSQEVSIEQRQVKDLMHRVGLTRRSAEATVRNQRFGY
jgi:excisionase family DNA binding protein